MTAKYTIISKNLKFEVGDKIKFIKTIGNEHLLVHGIITCDEIFEITKQNSRRTALISSVDEAAVSRPKPSELENIVKLMLDNQVSRDSQAKNSEELITSPQVKRKSRDNVERCMDKGCEGN